MGSIATADTLYATDGPLQDGTANMNALAPMSRLMGAGDLMVEYDQQYERYGVPQPQLLALQLLQTPLGLTDPVSFGTPRPNASIGLDAERAGPLGPGQRRLALARSSPTPCPTRGPWCGASPMRAPWSWRATPPASTTWPGSGLLNTDSAVYYAGTLADDPARLHDLASQGAQLVLTDTNRKQAFRWDTLTANSGYTETPEREPGQDRPERQPDRAVPRHDASRASRTPATSAR